VRLDTAEAVAALRLVDATSRGAQVPSEAWQQLFRTDGYRRLRERETAMGRAFTDSAFATFVRSDSLARRAPAIRQALRAWVRADVKAAASRALAYLPGDACIEATVYLVVKPRDNSFVFDVARDPAVFLYVDPARSAAEIENTIAHEFHHIGFASLDARAEAVVNRLPERVRPAAQWLGAFAEGFAMLAAAGGPDVHPHANSPASDRARWDRDVANFNADLRRTEVFFLDIVRGRLTHPDSIRAVASQFYGVQGPWYTVGWKMATVIERTFGREELIACMADPGRLVRRYNEAAARVTDNPAGPLARWSPELVQALQPGAPSP
jgi:hypothetical protein